MSDSVNAAAKTYVLAFLKEAASPPADTKGLTRRRAKKDQLNTRRLELAGFLAGLGGGALYAWKRRQRDIEAGEMKLFRYILKKVPEMYFEAVEKFKKTGAEKRDRGKSYRHMIVRPLLAVAMGAWIGSQGTRLFNVYRQMLPAFRILRKARKIVEEGVPELFKKTEEAAPGVIQPKPPGTSRFPRRWFLNGEEQLL